MRIDRLRLQNFKKFADFTIDLNPQFTLLVGENGSGKTSVLDGLAVALGAWLWEVPAVQEFGTSRMLEGKDIRVDARIRGDRTQFEECKPVRVSCSARLGEQNEKTEWDTGFYADTGAFKNSEQLRSVVRSSASLETNGEDSTWPVVANYGASRAWTTDATTSYSPYNRELPSRWKAYWLCLLSRIEIDELQEWFLRETIAAGNRGGRMRPGFEAVKRAVLECVPGADKIWFDPDRGEIVLSIDGEAQPFSNLSAGQRMMLALVADIAIKAITLNAHLLPPDELGPEDDPIPRVLAQTPGVVLIDELDVHLHPRWQRRITHDLKRIFPKIQFVATSHSPQIIGELKPEEIRILTDEGAFQPDRSYGMESGRVLEELMGASSRNQAVEERLGELSDLISQDRLQDAKATAEKLEDELGENDPDIVSAKNLVAFLEGEES